MTKLQKELRKSTLSFTNDYTVEKIEIDFADVNFYVSNDHQSDIVTFKFHEVYPIAKSACEEVFDLYVLMKHWTDDETVLIALEEWPDVYNDLLVQNTRMRVVSPAEFMGWKDTAKQYDYVEAWRTHCEKFGENPPNYIAAILTGNRKHKPEYTDLTEDENSILWHWMNSYDLLKELEAA